MTIRGLADKAMTAINKRANRQGVFRYASWWQDIWTAAAAPEEFWPATAREAKEALVELVAGGGDSPTDSTSVDETNFAATLPLYVGGAEQPSGVDKYFYEGGFAGQWLWAQFEIGDVSVPYGNPKGFVPVINPRASFFQWQPLSASSFVTTPGNYILAGGGFSVITAEEQPSESGLLFFDDLAAGAQASARTATGPSLPGGGDDFFLLVVGISPDTVLPNGCGFVAVDAGLTYQLEIRVLPLSYEIYFNGELQGTLSKVTSGPLLYVQYNVADDVLTFGNGEGTQTIIATPANTAVSLPTGTTLFTGAAGEQVAVAFVLGVTGTNSP